MYRVKKLLSDIHEIFFSFFGRLDCTSRMHVTMHKSCSIFRNEINEKDFLD